MGVADYFKRQLTIGFPIWRALIKTASKWLRSLAATNKLNSAIALCWPVMPLCCYEKVLDVMIKNNRFTIKH